MRASHVEGELTSSENGQRAASGPDSLLVPTSRNRDRERRLNRAKYVKNIHHARPHDIYSYSA